MSQRQKSSKGLAARVQCLEDIEAIKLLSPYADGWAKTPFRD